MSEPRHRFGGLSGVQFEGLPFDLGSGITLRATYASLQAPYLVNFDQTTSVGLPNPPWLTVDSGGAYFVVTAELEIPESYDPDAVGLDEIGLLWWIAALLRLRSTTVLFMPLTSDESFSAPKSLPQTTRFRLLEIWFQRRVPESSPSLVVSQSDLAWVRDTWRSGVELMRSSHTFNLLILALDAAALASPQQRGLELLCLWGALESLFSPARSELRFRISALIATYLEPFGTRRRALHRDIMKLYDARSKVVHTGRDSDYADVSATFALARRVALQVLATKSVPGPEDLEDQLFGS